MSHSKEHVEQMMKELIEDAERMDEGLDTGNRNPPRKEEMIAALQKS